MVQGQGMWGAVPLPYVSALPLQKRGSTFQGGFSMDRNVGSALCHLCQVPSCLSLPAVG